MPARPATPQEKAAAAYARTLAQEQAAETRRAERAARRAQEAAEIADARREYEEAHLIAGLPEPVRTDIWNMAWERGHDAGLHHVEQEYMDLAYLINSVVDAVRTAAR